MSKPKDDLISRAAALNAIDCWHIDFNSMDGAKVQTDCWRTIKELPAVNAVPVILCRNCKYGEPETNGFGEDMVMCQNKQNPIGYEDWLMPPEFYCADGERRG